MKLKEFIQEAGILKLMQKDVISKLIELESIDNWMQVMLGVELDINVNPVKPKEGRFYGVGNVEDLHK